MSAPDLQPTAQRSETRFTLVRHAQSTWNAAGRWQGHADTPLSARGREQASAAAVRLARRCFDRLVCSDLRRARDTASVIGAALGLAPEVRGDLRELDVGKWTGLTREEIAGSDAVLLAAFDSGDPDVRPGGGETRGELRARARAAAEALAADLPGGRILVVAHLGVLRALVPGSAPDHTEALETTLAAIREAAACGASGVSPAL